MTALRVEHLLKDQFDGIQGRVWAADGEPPEIAPWMLQKILFEGWTLTPLDARQTGIQVHGNADWHGVAENLATLMKVIVSDEGFDWGDEEAADQLLEQAQRAIDDFEVAQLEFALAFSSSPPDGDPEEEGEDGGESVGA